MQKLIFIKKLLLTSVTIALVKETKSSNFVLEITTFLLLKI